MDRLVSRRQEPRTLSGDNWQFVRSRNFLGTQCRRCTRGRAKRKRAWPYPHLAAKASEECSLPDMKHDAARRRQFSPAMIEGRDAPERRPQFISVAARRFGHSTAREGDRGRTRNGRHTSGARADGPGGTQN